jgi:hypothetical protein
MQRPVDDRRRRGIVIAVWVAWGGARMGENDVCPDPSLHEACRSVGLALTVQHTRLVPRAALGITPDDPPSLLLTMAEDEPADVRVLDVDGDARAFLVLLTEERVQREPVMNLYLPRSTSQRLLVHREQGAWRVTELPDGPRIQTVEQARQALAGRDR